MQEKLGEDQFSRLADSLNSRIDLYQAVGHSQSLKGVRVARGQYSVFDGKPIDPPKIIWTVEKKAAATAFSNWPTTLASGETREAAIAAFKKAIEAGTTDINKPADRQVTFDIYSYRSGAKAGKWYIGKKIGKEYFDIESFDDAKSARKYLAEHRDELVEKLDRFRNIPSERKETNEPRVGVDHRNSTDVAPERFMETFGFRGVQFGNYVEGAKRQQDLNEAYDALLDMAGVLGIPPRALSLNGELGLAFGARGKGAAGVGRGKAPKAHYEPGHVVINLTKDKGAGSLAHEWWHSLDNYFSRARGEKGEYLTETVYQNRAGIRPEMVSAFDEIRKTVNNSGLRQRAKALDRTRTAPYWSTGREMSARAFESYVVEKLRDQGASNDYLANIVGEDYWNAAAALDLEKEGTYPYPEAAEIPAVRAAFDNFFQAVETRETAKGMEMYEPGTAYGGVAVAPVAEYPVREDEKAYQTDLFGDRLPDQGGKRPKAPIGRHVLAATAVRSLEVNDKDTGTFAVETALISERSRKIPVSRITTADEAAAAFAYLYDYAVEHFDAIVTDKSGKPLAVVGSFKGTFNSTAVYTSVLLHEAFRVRGAAKIWLSHNHPSGVSDLSRADEVLHDRIVPFFRGAKIELKGMFAIGDGQYTFRANDGYTTTGAVKKPPGQGAEIPVVERVFKKNERLGQDIDSPEASKSVVPSLAGGQAGLVLLDQRHRPVAFVPVSKEDAGMLRTKGRMDRLYRAMSRANAAAAIIANPNDIYTEGEQANLAAFVNANDARALDIISYAHETETGAVSDASSAAGKGWGDTSTVFFSRKTQDLPADADLSNLTPDDLLKLFDSAERIELETPKKTEAEVDADEARFLSDAPAGTRYGRRTRLLAGRIRPASDAAVVEIGGAHRRESPS